jgi:hypothetical protein
MLGIGGGDALDHPVQSQEARQPAARCEEAGLPSGNITWRLELSEK